MRIFGLLPAAERRVRLPARIGLLGLAVASSSLALGPVNEQERSYNKYRTGADTAETVLTPANVKSTANLFHKHFVMKVDGKIEGSPLYASAVAIAGGIHNVLYGATVHNTVFAFDADTGRSFPCDGLALPSPDLI